jgi:hypothetical protein
MTIQIHDLVRMDGGGARRGVVRSTIALALAAVAALAASATSASPDKAGAKSVWSYGFDDSLWTNGPERSRTLSPLAGWALRCFVNCGPAFGTFVVRRIELLTSNTADVSVNKTADPSGHALGVSGMIVTERLEPDSFGADPGSWTDWGVIAERALDSNGTHSWSLLSPDISLDAHWLPIELYGFEGSSLSMDFAAGARAGATPESSTWAMMHVGFAGLSVAGYRSSKNYRRSIHFPKGTYPR